MTHASASIYTHIAVSTCFKFVHLNTFIIHVVSLYFVRDSVLHEISIDVVIRAVIHKFIAVVI